MKRPSNQATIPFWRVPGRIAYIVSHSYPYSSNGYAVRTHGIATALRQHGHSVIVINRPGRPWDLSGFAEPSFPRHQDIDGVRYLFTPEPSRRALTAEAWLEAAAASLKATLRLFKPSVVMAASNWENAMPGCVAAQALGLPFFYEVRGFWEITRVSREPEWAQSAEYREAVERETWVAQQAERVFTLNSLMRDELVRRGVSAEKIELVPNGINQLPVLKCADPALKSRLGIAEGERVIGYIGSFNPYEGLDLLLDACTELVQSGEKLKLLLVGDDQPLIAASASHLADTGLKGAPPWLIKVGRVPHEQVAVYYALLDAVVIPRKPLAVCQLVPPMKAVESLAHGKRLVVSDVAPLAEYAEKFDGVVSFEADSAKSLATALQKSLRLREFKPTTKLLLFTHTERIVHSLIAFTTRRETQVSSYGEGNDREGEKNKLGISPLSGKKPKDSYNSIVNSNKTNNNSRALIFTNLGLSTIDGSSVFIANLINIYSKVFKEVYLLSVQKVGPNFEARLHGLKNLKTLFCDPCSVKEKINQLDRRLKFNTIFIRSWGSKKIWFDKSYASKVCYYWPLTETPDKEDEEVFHHVGELAFQTEELRQKTLNLMGDKKNILVPPCVITPKDNGNLPNRGAKTVVSYIGSLRPECYSKNLLNAFLGLASVKNRDCNVEIKIAIGKIHYRDTNERSEIIFLLNKLKLHYCVSVEEKVSRERCDEIIKSSDLAFSLWEPNSQNSIQISTKLLECLSAGCYVICFRTPLHKKLLGDNYPFYIDDPEDLEEKISEFIQNRKKLKLRYSNRYALSFFSLEWHVLNVSRHYDIDLPEREDIERRLFSSQYDQIYGIYINEPERRKLEFISKKRGIPISYFKGTDARRELKEEFVRYSRKPLCTEWERQQNRKRLTLGAIGHLATFINIAQDALKNQYRKVLIFEADVLLHNFFFSLNFEKRPKDFKVHYLGAGKWNKNLQYFSSGDFYRPNQTTGTFAVAFDSEALKALLKEWRKFVEPTDVAMWPVVDWFYEECYVSTPNLAICDVTTSSISQKRSQKKISEKFDWDLKQYDVRSIQHINKFCSRLAIELENVMPPAFIKLLCQSREIVLRVDGTSVCVYLHDVLVDIEYENTLIKNVDCFP